MKKILKLLGAVLPALFLCPKIYAAAGGQQIVDTYLPINPVQAYSSTFSIRTDGLNWASAQVLVTSVTAPAQTFTDGQAATATLTVVSFVGLSTANATNKLTISSDTALVGSCISGGGPNTGNFNVCNPGNFSVDLVYSSNTACNIASAINATGVILSTCGTVGGSVVYDTAAYAGAIFNSFQIASSTAALTVSNLISSSTLGGVYIGSLAGGQSNQTFSINGNTFTANQPGTFGFYPVTSTGQTATNIASAITAAGIGVVAGAGGSVVYATAAVVGTVGNSYATSVSSDPALTLSTFVSSGTTVASGFMSGGTNPAYTINTAPIALPGNNFGTGLAVLYTNTGSALTPLLTGTTYYVITLGNGVIQLAVASTSAVAGTPIVLTSSQVKTTADTYTLSPLAITGTPGVQWVVSNDNTNWVPYTLTPFNISISSVSYGSYSAAGTLNTWDFGHMDYSWLGLNVTAPTTGALTIKAKLAGDQ